MEPLFLLIGLVVGLVVGAVAAAFALRSRRETGTHADEQRIAELTALRERAAAAETDAAAARATSEARAEQIGILLAEQRAQQQRSQEESRVLQELAPVKETLLAFQRSVAELEAQRSRQHGELAQQLRAAGESEERLRATAETLASALRNNATRGVWGETQLRTLVESAGLLNRVDFTMQSTIEAESGTRRPDMIVNLPGGKQIPVDAKVPYNAYIEAAAIPASATGEQERARTELLAKHAKQVRGHVDALAAKSYWTGLEASPDFTIAFIPNEPLLAAATEQDPTLMEYAFTKRIILANPGTLWALLKTIAFTWQQDVLTEDAKVLFDLGKELYGRLSTLSEHADKLRRSIESTVSSYNQFASSLEQRVLVTARKLDQLDESKVIGTPGEIDVQPKTLVQPEVAATDRAVADQLRRELGALDGTGIARPELDLGLPTERGRTTKRSA
jgi:DNA recombination protein RmuC